MNYVVYLIRCKDGSLYCGIAQDFEKRLAEHAAGKGAKYTRGRGPFTVEVVSRPQPKGYALRLEAFVKRLPRNHKIPYLKTFA